MLVRLFVLAVTMSFSWCHTALPDQPPNSTSNDSAAEDAVYVRIHNAAEFDFDDIKVHFSIQSESYGSLSRGAFSEYRQIELAYRYASIVVLVNGQEYRYRPFDYAGETPLDPGRYTYHLGGELTFNPNIPGSLSLKLERDGGGT